MSIFGINGTEFLLLIVLGIVILGPERLPEYAAKLARLIHKLRVMAEGAKGQLKEQLGPEFEDVNWRQYDPRQYDPRRIVKQALLDPIEEVMDVSRTTAEDIPAVVGADAVPFPSAAHLDRPTPWDSEAT